MNKLETELQAFYMSSEIVRCEKQEDYLLYDVPAAYLESAIKRANEVIKNNSWSLVAKRVSNTRFSVEENLA